MSDNRLFLYSIIGFFAGLFFFFKGFGWLKLKRLIENTPTSKIRSIAMGLVEVFGEAIPSQGKILKSPLTNNDCVYYQYVIKELQRIGKSTWWTVVMKGEDMQDFFLKDDSGIVLVDPKYAQMEIPLDFEAESRWGVEPPSSVKQFMKKNKISFEGVLGANKTMRFEERFIAPKDKLYIMGTAGDNPYVEEATAMKNTADIMIKKGRNEKIFYISDKPEKEVLFNLTTRVMFSLFGGAVLTIGSLAYILLYLRLF